MRLIRLRGGAFLNREEWHRYLKKSFSFPDYYGENLDALADALAEVSEETMIQVSEFELWKERLGGYFESAWATLCEGVDENPFLRMTTDFAFCETSDQDD